MTPASKVGEAAKIDNSDGTAPNWPEWQIRAMEALLLREGFPAHRVKGKAVQILDWAAMTFIEREVDRAVHGAAMDQPIGILGVYKGDGV